MGQSASKVIPVPDLPKPSEVVKTPDVPKTPVPDLPDLSSLTNNINRLDDKVTNLLKVELMI
jgi:hypothetical protein